MFGSEAIRLPSSIAAIVSLLGESNFKSNGRLFFLFITFKIDLPSYLSAYPDQF